jgi:hypothetical protein
VIDDKRIGILFANCLVGFGMAFAAWVGVNKWFVVSILAVMIVVDAIVMLTWRERG